MKRTTVTNAILLLENHALTRKLTTFKHGLVLQSHDMSIDEFPLGSNSLSWKNIIAFFSVPGKSQILT